MTRTADIERLLRAGERLRTRCFDIKRLASTIGLIRIAIVVPKFEFTVVRRNKLKRRLRELARLHILPQSGSFDLMLRARRETYEVTFENLREEILVVARQLS